MTINAGTIVSVDTNGGAAIWNEDDLELVDNNYYYMPDSFDPTDEYAMDCLEFITQTDGHALADPSDDYVYKSRVNMNFGEGHIYLTYYKYKLNSSAKLIINGGTFTTNYVGSASESSGPGCLNNSGAYAEIHGGTFTSNNQRVYSIISTGEIIIDESISNVEVYGAHGAIGIEYGKAVINGGSFTAKNFYGFWITNNGNVSNVTINGGKFSGKYGLYSTVDDGKQDAGNVSIKINDGLFSGTTKAAVAINPKGSENSWGMLITGGVFNSDVSAYVDADKSYIYTLGEDSSKKYVVVTDVSVKIDNENIADENSESLLENTLQSVVESAIKGESISGVSENLAQAIKESVAEKKEVSSALIIEEVAADNLEDCKDDVESTLPKGSNIAGYFDITLAVFADEEVIGNISELDKPIKLTFDIPADLPELKDGMIRKYTVIRIHDGKVEELETTVNDNGTISFETDKFSTFIFSYVDEKEPVTPNTLDKSMIYMSIGLVSLGLALITFKKIKKQYNRV